LRVEGRELTVVTGANREQDLANIDAGNSAVRLAPRTTHAGLQPIGAGAGQHLVDADDMVRVGADAEVEAFFASDFDKIPIPQATHQYLTLLFVLSA